MKRVWVSKKFSYIFEASPSKDQACFMQSLYAYCSGYMVSTHSLLSRLGGLYCLYCLYETQPFKPPFKIYISLGDLKNLRNIVAEAKAKGVKVAPALVKRTLDRNMFLFGSVDVNEGSVAERLDELMEIQNASIRIASKKLFANTRIEHFTHMDMGVELEVDLLKQKSAEYARAKELAIRAARDMVDVENIKHITEKQTLIGDVVEKTAEDWKAQKELFYQQIGYQPVKDSLDIVKEKQEKFSQQEVAEEQDGNEDFGKELEAVLLSEQNECDFEE
uniref:Uncharacterized protein LOC104212432 isoform X2 n=1 Tax=Nicotiana sylvestris TaxID=4096 RepID=A0A1U7V4U9_NICSY|nr:PREDICTED: uncharacterized protein LOC104212432 isoform X2 [Nicotiana sylvestris]XP_009759989.1 PREDICTED: uncharacterized protein LOC104212432 isoform X2 [Nicotiana sylvestris]XP_009759990.1 PREDICTED: uncharacterized protein LOC104212432 isoform X2 [Nicotiana sylvestris]XP_009759991.1 PREDICTED: uncharacterized protein LOC104212432 isoform X2 [Nicotiana sylvestris]XP_009759992.1 PREDICTED: uncharacterized protein LOC104212432 isoform X2 [Nicotiana sylvestris]XP_009759993.1 PREDICTED: unch